MSDPHEQMHRAIDAAADEFRNAGRWADENRWLTRAVVLAAASIADSLRKLVTIDEPYQPQPEPVDPFGDGYAALCSLQCVLLPGHDGQCVPPAPASRADADLGETALARPYVAAPTAPATGPMPAVTP